LETVTAQQAWTVFRRADRLFSAAEVEAAIARMAAAASPILRDQDPLVVCMMNGGVVLFGKLLPRFDFPLQVDYIHVTRYGRRLTGGELDWRAGPFVDPLGRVVLLVDDILDEGTTLAAVEAHYHAHGARAVHKAVLVSKSRKRSVDIDVDFVGVTVPDRYVFGYGMDYKGYLRNVPGIYAVAEDTPVPPASERP
jgi:hypoxanthine phosphoribosyltransferase